MAVVGALGGARIFGARREKGRVDVKIYAFEEEPLACESPVARWALRFWEIVTFSFVGSSVRVMPKTERSCSCAELKTCLNARVFGARTFALMSALRIGWREYSLARARRMSFLTNWSCVLASCDSPSRCVGSSSAEETSGVGEGR